MAGSLHAMYAQEALNVEHRPRQIVSTVGLVFNIFCTLQWIRSRPMKNADWVFKPDIRISSFPKPRYFLALINSVLPPTNQQWVKQNVTSWNFIECNEYEIEKTSKNEKHKAINFYDIKTLQYNNQQSTTFTYLQLRTRPAITRFFSILLIYSHWISHPADIIVLNQIDLLTNPFLHLRLSMARTRR